MKRDRTIIAVAVLVMVIVGVVSFLVRSPSQVSTVDVRRSSLRTTPDGVAAFSRALAVFGQPTEARITPLVDRDPLRGTLFLLEPTIPPSPREVRATLEWVRGGGTLVYAPRFISRNFEDFRQAPSPVPGVSPRLLDSLGLAVRRLPPGAMSDSTYARYWIATALSVADDENAPEPDSLPPAPLFTPLLQANSSSTSSYPTAVRVELGEGTLIILADARPLSNQYAPEASLSLLVIRATLEHTSPGDTVFFDEFHHGVRRRSSAASVLVGFLRDDPWGRTLLHLSVVSFLVLAFAGLRLGAPRDPPQVERRSPLDHVSALARLYQRANAHESAAFLLMARLARSARRPPPRSATEIDSLLAALPTGHGQEEAALLQVRRGFESRPPDLGLIAEGIDNYTEKGSHI